MEGRHVFVFFLACHISFTRELSSEVRKNSKVKGTGTQERCVQQRGNEEGGHPGMRGVGTWEYGKQKPGRDGSGVETRQ